MNTRHILLIALLALPPAMAYAADSEQHAMPTPADLEAAAQLPPEGAEADKDRKSVV